MVAPAERPTIQKLTEHHTDKHAENGGKQAPRTYNHNGTGYLSFIARVEMFGNSAHGTCRNAQVSKV